MRPLWVKKRCSEVVKSSSRFDGEVVVREVETVLFPLLALAQFRCSLETNRYFQNRPSVELPTSSFPEEVQMRRADFTDLAS